MATKATTARADVCSCQGLCVFIAGVVAVDVVVAGQGPVLIRAVRTVLVS